MIFYRLRAENPKLTKAEIIRLVQKEMIEGKFLPSKENKNRARNTAKSENKTIAPEFEYEQKKPYAHPYFWSPFVLIGNWQ